MRTPSRVWQCLRAALRPARLSCAVVLAGVLAGGPRCALAQTQVSGPIAASTRWSAAESPYLVAADVVVNNGATLSIDPGVTIYMAPGTNLNVSAGALKAAGTAQLPVRVLSDKQRTGSAAPGDWGQWIFNSTAAASVLEHVVFEHGRGLAVNGASPVFNFLDVRNQLGAAITIDLAASPSGVGNRASGNSLNGIAVPAGDIGTSVRWQLRGIPYVLQSGTVSVGVSPVVTSVSPASIERGQTLTLTVTGSRLEGFSSASFSRDGLSVTPFSGGSATQLGLQVRASDSAALGKAALRLQLDAGEIVVTDALTVSPPLPAISAVAPNSVTAGTGPVALTVSGRNFNAQSEVLVNSAAIPTQFSSATELRATLPGQTAAGTLMLGVRSPDPQMTGQYLMGSGSLSLVVAPAVPPTVAFEPTPIALPPDNLPHDVTIRLSKADFRDHSIDLSTSDAAKASVSPVSLTIPAGKTSARFAITPRANGSVTLRANSATLGSSSVPLFITADFSGVNTSYAKPVGIVVEGAAAAASASVTVTHASVGVSVGAILTGVSPGGWALGTTQSFVVQGRAIPAGVQVAFVPGDGLSVGTVSVAADGSSFSVPVTAAAGAAPGPRRVVVRDGAGALLTFADAARSTVTLTSGLPAIDSIEPLQTVAGSTLQLLVRGRFLQGARLQVLPAAGLEVDSQPQVNATGTELRAALRIAPEAMAGARVVQISTSAGATPADVGASNTFLVVSAIRETYTPIASRLVRVVVGNAATQPERGVATPFLSPSVGVVLGGHVTEVSPRVAVVGTEQTVTVRGQGLAGVTGVSITPTAGLTLGTPSLNADGTQLSFSVRTDANAAVGLRRLALNSAAGRLLFIRPTDESFLVTAPVPELDSVAPQVILAGSAATTIGVQGRNFGNVSGVRIDPPQGVTVSGPISANPEGTQLSFVLQADAAASSGTRTVIVSTAAGESSGTALAGNTLRLASQLGARYADLATTPVGVVVGTPAKPSTSYDGALMASSVGVMVGQVSAVAPKSDAVSPRVGVVTGVAATEMTPTGWLQGASGVVTVSGVGLQGVAKVDALPAEGLLFEAPSVVADGSRLTVAISVAPNAALIQRRLRLTGDAGQVIWTEPRRALFDLGSLPTMSSISPIVLPRGKATVLTIRGANLKGVTAVTLLPEDGVLVTGAPAWSQDSFGELLTVGLFIESSVANGDRVLRLEVPGGGTSTTPSVVNSLKVVAQ